MSDALTDIEAERFAATSRSGSPSRRAVVLRDTDVRLILASGRLGRPSAYFDVTPHFNTPHEWTTIAADFAGPIVVTDPKRACLVVFKSSSKVGERLAEELPSVEIEALLFPNEGVMRQWTVKSKTFDGLPLPLPVRVDVIHPAQFVAATSGEMSRWAPSDPPDCDRDEQDRVAGGLVGTLVRGDVSRTSWDRIVAFQNPSRSDLEDLWHTEHQVERGAVSAVLNVLADANWGVGFDPVQMLESLHHALSPHYAPSDLDAWRSYVANILSNREEAKLDGLRDAGKTLLRALELFMRAPQPSISRIADEIRARDSGSCGDVGRHVGSQALALAGWFEGFAATGSIVKHEPGLYAFGCRVAAKAKRHPTRFEVRAERLSNYGRRFVLVEGGIRIAEVREEPPPLLLKALHSAQEVCTQMSWTCSFEEESHVICIRNSDWEVRAKLVDRDVLCWQCDVELPKIPKQRTWPKGFPEWVLASAREWWSSVAFSKGGFPRLEIRHHAWIRTLDDEEVRFAIHALLGTRDRLLEWRPDFKQG